MRPPDWSAPPRDSLESEDVVSPDATTPRGGFMARPGLKRPPQHAVVVRVGDAPESEHIPVARASLPPSPPVSPASEPAAAPRLEVVPETPPRPTSSVPPPSEMPVVASVRAPASFAPSRARSRWAIVLAAAAGLLLGLASVVTRARSFGESRSAAQPQSGEPVGYREPSAPAASASASLAPTPSVVEEPRATAATPVVPSASAAEPAPQPRAAPAGRPSDETPRRTIF